MPRRPLPLVALLVGLVAGAVALPACAPAQAPTASAPAVASSSASDYVPSAEEEVFLDTLQHRTFRWFWERTDPETGLVPDRWPTESFSSIAAIGFGLPAYGIGAERGYVSRSDAAERTLNTLRYLYTRPQGPRQLGTAGHRGYFYHFLEYDDGTRFRNTELSTIDTALLMAGVLFSREYFDAADPAEQDIRAYADSLYQRVEWPFFDRPDATDDPRLMMGWYPESDFGPAYWQGYNEGMILYLLGLGSPTHPLDATVWPAWTDTYEWEEFYGYPHVNFTPLFGHQYSHLFVDFRGIQDEWMRDRSAEIGEPYDYFENSRRATLSQRAYAADNPNDWVGYSDRIWGLTASDGPSDERAMVNGEMRQFHTYWARGASADHVNDDGTIAPTATGGSIPFAPEVTIPALVEIARQYPAVWTDDYGFRDAFNPSFTATDVPIKPNSEVTPQGWVDHDYLGIDQGPILIMAENYRTGLVWETLKKSPYLVRGLQRAGFRGGWLDGARARAVDVLDLPPARTAEPEGRRLVVVLGSSTAEGYGPSASDSTWVNRLRHHLEGVDPTLDVLNLARGGYTTYHVLPVGDDVPDDLGGAPDPDRNIEAALAQDPVAIVVGLTSNDAARGYSNEEQQANFERIAGLAEAAGVPFYVTTTAPRNLDDAGRARQAAVRAWLLTRFGDRAVDVWDGIALPDGTLDPRYDMGDGIHQNDAGHRLIFERVLASGLMDDLTTAR
ncbi:glucoamylase family protein [Rubrivirga sp.]|uniref:glucoamylase family protein n=1 Tax=Rubrivirga sp. TaxID=1885344 RepID=UPI003B518C5C